MNMSEPETKKQKTYDPAKDNPRCFYWNFTWNNYTDENVDYCKSLYPAQCEYIVFGYEIGECGTPHLQGFMRMKSQMYLKTVTKLMKGCHVMPVRKTPEKAAEYCRKDGNFEEFGSLKKSEQGKRNDIESFIEAAEAKEVKTYDEALQKFPLITAKYRHFVKDYILMVARKAVPPILFEKYNLWEWQRKLWEELRREADDRKIVFIVDKKGGKGKTYFCNWLYNQLGEKVQVMKPGKTADMAFHYNELSTKVFILDAPRSKQNEYLQYDFLENVKDGRLFSPKYESKMKVFKSPHVVVMMNEEPDMTKLSRDRYDIRFV